MDFLKIIIWLGVFFIVGLILGVSLNNPAIFITVFLASSSIYLVYKIFNIKSFATKTKVQLSENSVEFISGNLTSNTNVHVPFGQIQGTTVEQSFITKLFVISSLLVTDEKGVTTSLWGFEKKEADEFAREISRKSQERIQVSKS